jgi:hypothetical protein
MNTPPSSHGAPMPITNEEKQVAAVEKALFLALLAEPSQDLIDNLESEVSTLLEMGTFRICVCGIYYTIHVTKT